MEAITQRREALVDLLLREHHLAGLGVLAVLQQREHARLHAGAILLPPSLCSLRGGEERLRLGDLRGRGLDDERRDVIAGIGSRHVQLGEVHACNRGRRRCSRFRNGCAATQGGPRMLIGVSSLVRAGIDARLAVV